MIYFSILGFNDSEIDIKDPFNTCGATVNIFMGFKDDINSVYLFFSKTGTDSDKFLRRAVSKMKKL